MAINNLFSALQAAPVDPAQTQFYLESFDTSWQDQSGHIRRFPGRRGLSGLELGFMYWLFGLLLIISSLGYFVDALGTLLNPNYSLALSTYTFIGEVAFIFWLLIRGRKLPDTAVSNER